MASSSNEELVPTIEPGYKITEKKSLEEYQKLDANDESLNKWKASLGLTSTGAGPSKVVVTKLSLQVPSPTPLVVEFPGQKTDKYVVKEGVDAKVELCFKVLNGIVTGLRYMHLVKRLGIKVDKTEEMLGSFPPGDFVKLIDLGAMPEGFLARGLYDVTSIVIDDDKVEHFRFDWKLDLRKDWN